MTPQEFVTKVFHAQNGVIIDDLYPNDDKYREILSWLEMVIHQFVALEEWSFLREAIVLGPVDPEPGYENKVPKFILPDRVDHVCTLYDDSIKLHTAKNFKSYHGESQPYYNINEEDFICVPYSSKGFDPKREPYDNQIPLVARVYHPYIEFNRKPIGKECNRIAVADCQLKPHIPHICNENCIADEYKLPDGSKSTEVNYDPKNYHPCNKIEKEILKEFPYKDYFITKTAYYSATNDVIGAQSKIELDNICKERLSNIRKIETAKTSPDYLDDTSKFYPIEVL